jgi:membrane-bound serine protease (ClpP class)
MAPATNIGAAHPVAVGAGGAQSQDETMAAKTTNDLAAWARAIATQRGRNGDWAAEAVEKSVSIPAEEALEKRVIELMAPDLPALLVAADGRTVQTAGGTVVLRTRGARIEPIPATPRERLLNALGDPNIAFLLIGLGILGLLAELSAPGTLAPGLIGAISLALGLLATRMLPVRAGAVVLMLLGGVLLAAELFVTSWGLLALAGIVCLGLGGFLLINPSSEGFLVDQGYGVALGLVLPVLIVVAAILALVVWKIIKSRSTPESTGAFGLVGEVGTVVEDVGPERGKIFVHGELWAARAQQPISKGTRVKVERVRGLVVDVLPIGSPPSG